MCMHGMSFLSACRIATLAILGSTSRVACRLSPETIFSQGTLLRITSDLRHSCNSRLTQHQRVVPAVEKKQHRIGNWPGWGTLLVWGGGGLACIAGIALDHIVSCMLSHLVLLRCSSRF